MVYLDYRKTNNMNDKVEEFDAMWSSSLTDSTAKGKPDIGRLI